MNKYTVLGSIILIGVIGAGCFYIGKGQREIVIEEKIIYKEGETKIEYRDRTVIKEKIIKPDGTIIEREITKNIEKEIEKRSKELAQEISKKITPVLSNYSLGVRYWLPLSYNELLNRQTYSKEGLEITAGKRIVGEIWLEGGYKLDNSFSLGVSYKF